MFHDFIQTGDPDSHRSIEDGNGEVVLAQCRVCGQAEVQLEAECPGPRNKPVTTKQALEKAPRKKLSKIAPGTIAAILGVSPTMKRENVVREMVRAYHGAESEYKANIAVEYADEMRETAMNVFLDKFKRNLHDIILKKPSKLIGGQQAGIKSDNYDGLGLVYLRLPYGQRDAASPKDFKTIDQQSHHYAQMQLEMHAAGCTWGVFAQWAVCSQRYDVVKLDTGFIEETLPQLEAFYEHVKAEVKNPLHLEPLRKSIDNDKVRKALDEYDELALSITNAKARQAELLEGFKAMAKGSSVMLCGRSLTMSTSPGSLSYASIVRKHLPDLDLEQYRGEPSTKWTLT